MDYIAFCKKLCAATGIPVTLYSNGHVQYSTLADLLDITPQDTWTIYEPSKNPEFNSINPDLEYGHVRVEGTGYDIFLGPIFTQKITWQLIHEYFREAKTPPDKREAVTEYLYGMPTNSHAQLVRYLLFLHLCLNHKEANTEDFYTESEDAAKVRSSRILDTSIEDKENDAKRSSYFFELKLYHHIRQGNTVRLKAFLDNTMEMPSEGKTACSPLRHVKNTFIMLASKISIMAAIPAGIDPDRAYQLCDLYIMECERMQSIEEVRRLQYIMLMDFCGRCGSAQLPAGISREIIRSMNYIQNHTNELIKVEDVARYIHRSGSYLMHHFKAELGMSVSNYITKCKLEEACTLLTYGSMSLGAISSYLGYSSQSYFQNVFKKQYNMTPAQYRKEHQRLS